MRSLPRSVLRLFLLIFVAPYSWPVRCRYDLHDYPDGDVELPWHFYTHTCRRCGKKFTI